MSEENIEDYISEHIFEDLDEDEFSSIIYENLKD